MGVDEAVVQGKRTTRLGLLRLVARLTSSSAADQRLLSPPRSVLLIRPDHVGDVLFTAPALRLLRQAWPHALIGMLVGPWAKPVVEGIPHVDEIITCPFPWFSRQPRKWLLEPYLLLLNEAQRLRAYNFDLAVVLRFDHWWGAWLAQRAGIPRRVGYDVAEVAPFLTRPVPYLVGRHEVLQNATLIETIVGHSSSQEDDLNLEFEPLSKDEKAANDLLAAEGIQQNDALACVHPGSGAPVKLWRNEGWAQVIEALLREYGLKILISGGPAEKDLVQDLVKRLTVPVVNLAGRTNLGQLATLLGRCRLVLGVDSGPLHLAVAMQTPTIHLFGPVSARLFGPWGDPWQHVVVTSTRECIPCNRLDYAPEELPAHPCVHEITVDQVLDAVRRLLGAPSLVKTRPVASLRGARGGQIIRP